MLGSIGMTNAILINTTMCKNKLTKLKSKLRSKIKISNQNWNIICKFKGQGREKEGKSRPERVHACLYVRVDCSSAAFSTTRCINMGHLKNEYVGKGIERYKILYIGIHEEHPGSIL